MVNNFHARCTDRPAALVAPCVCSSQRTMNMDFLKDLWGFLKVRKKFWLLPIILFMLLFGVLVVLTGGTAIAPFIYAIF